MVTMRADRMIRRLLATVGLMAALQVAPAFAQDPYAPAILVNEKAVTNFEISQRTRLLEAFGAGGDLRALAVEQLIDDRLKQYAAEQFGFELPEEAVERGFGEFAQRRELTTEQVTEALLARGISVETLLDFLKSAITWRELVQGRFRARAMPSEEDLDAALDFTQNSVQESVLLQEISIPVEIDTEDQTMALATRLSRDLNRGGNFNAAVARYSKAASAARGGRLDWVPASSLPGDVAGQVLALMPGEVTAPIPIPNGVTIVKLLNIRSTTRPAEASTSLRLVYSQLIIPLARNAPESAVSAALQQAETLRSEIRFCSDIDSRADEFGVGSGRSDPTPVNSVPSSISLRLAGMDVNGIDVARDDRGVVLLMLCSRSDETSPEQRESLRLRLFNERMGSLGQGFLQDLRGNAVIEYR